MSSDNSVFLCVQVFDRMFEFFNLACISLSFIIFSNIRILSILIHLGNSFIFEIELWVFIIKSNSGFFLFFSIFALDYGSSNRFFLLFGGITWVFLWSWSSYHKHVFNSILELFCNSISNRFNVVFFPTISNELNCFVDSDVLFISDARFKTFFLEFWL